MVAKYKSTYDKVMESDATPAVLKTLLKDIVPSKNLKALKEMVASGEITPYTASPEHKLANALGIIMSADSDAGGDGEWLKTLFSKNPEAVCDPNLRVHSYGGGQGVTSLRRYDGENVSNLSFFEHLRTRKRLKFDELIDVSTDFLLMSVQDGDRNVPFVHTLVSNEQPRLERYEALEKKLGSAAFINSVDDRGETMFYKIVSARNFIDDRRAHDVATWMLMKNPDLVNVADRLGWTPLDRHVSEALDPSKTNDMLALLVTSGAKLNRQIAPQFNLSAEVERRSEEKMDKPAFSGPKGLRHSS